MSQRDAPDALTEENLERVADMFTQDIAVSGGGYRAEYQHLGALARQVVPRLILDLRAARAELARVTALREAVAHVLVCHAAVVAAATPKRGGPDPMFVDVSTEQARLDDAVDELAALAQASERAAGSGEGE